ncbi:MAG: hypothetical protein U1F43_35665 [Myxococcota bacterium]
MSFPDTTVAPTSTQPTPDTADAPDGQCGTFGCPCTSNANCLDGLCIEGPDGFLCTRTCITDCPDGFDCLTTSAFGTDPVSCARRATCASAARACATTTARASSRLAPATACPAADPSQGNCGSSCEAACPAPRATPARRCSSTTARLDKQVPAHLGPLRLPRLVGRRGLHHRLHHLEQRRPLRRTRTCRPHGLTSCDGAIPSLETCNDKDDDCKSGIKDDIEPAPCTVDNGFGHCPGINACAGGRPVCDGPTPVSESCNGHDDDCDGQTDEGTCDDGLACTTDTCGAGGACSHTLVAGACLIAGTCFEAAQPMPGDPCQACLPALSTSDWSVADGAPCDDGDLCTWNDTCVGGACDGQTHQCNDGIACTVDHCDGDGGCTATQAAGTCFIDGACVADGALKAPGSAASCATPIRARGVAADRRRGLRRPRRLHQGRRLRRRRLCRRQLQLRRPGRLHHRRVRRQGRLQPCAGRHELRHRRRQCYAAGFLC